MTGAGLARSRSGILRERVLLSLGDMGLATPRVELRPRYARVLFDDGHRADFHWIWLRHECDQERHPDTRERTLGSQRIEPEIHPRDAWVEDGALHVRWQDDASTRPPSRYALDWLREHAYARDRVEVPPPPDLAGLETTLASDDALLPSDWSERLARDGALIARHPPGATRPEHTERLITQITAEGLSVIGTHFGRIEDLRTDNTTNQNTDQLGYTDAAIDLHTDQPFLDEPPRYQLLHCMRPGDVGGESAISDALRAARTLAAEDAEAYRVLTRVPVRFHRRQRAFERLVVSPVIDDTPDRFRVRLSPFTMAPHQVAFAEMEGLYRAYARFVRELERHAVRTVLQAGDVLLYDNHRMVHARTEFRGPRWVRGVYFDASPRGGAS